MIKKKINIVCLQETKCTGKKSREIDNSGLKLWYTYEKIHRQGQG